MFDVPTGSKRILIVDDEPVNLKVLNVLLQSMGHQPRAVGSGEEALAALDEDVDLVLLDIMMPRMDGFEVLERIRGRPEYRDLPVVMVTSLRAREDRLRAVESGANDFITKPIDATELRVRTTSLLRMKAYHDEVKRYQAHLEFMVDEKTAALKAAMEELRQAQEKSMEAQMETIRRLSTAAESRDDDTGSHINRVSHYCALLARRLGLSEAEETILLHTSPLHDVGKIATPDAILNKPGRLTADEWEIMKAHTTEGARILGPGPSPSEFLEAGRTIALSHHEKWDGSGYPQGLAGTDIPIYGRICAVADVFDALTSARPYKSPFSNEKSLGILREGRGSHFDPEILDAFLASFREVEDIQRRFSDAPAVEADL